MPDVFISYSTADSEVAFAIHDSCKEFGIEAFLAEISLEPGANWKEDILENLELSDWFFFLATKNSIHSAACMNEIGAALAHKKDIVPILIDIDGSELPDWISEYQGIYIANTSLVEIEPVLKRIGRKKTRDSILLGLFIGFVVGAVRSVIGDANKS